MKKLDYLERDQISTIHRLGKVRNTNRVLKDLSPFLSSFKDEYKTVYYLSPDGREYVNSQKIRRKNQFVPHVVMRNQFYIFSGFPKDWQNEMKLSDGKYTVICDALFKKGGKYHCLEIDNIQKMRENRVKISNYKGMFERGIAKQQLGHFPLLIWVTTTELRRKQLLELCEGLPVRVYTIDEIK